MLIRVFIDDRPRHRFGNCEFFLNFYSLACLIFLSFRCSFDLVCILLSLKIDLLFRVFHMVTIRLPKSDRKFIDTSLLDLVFWITQHNLCSFRLSSTSTVSTDLKFNQWHQQHYSYPATTDRMAFQPLAWHHLKIPFLSIWRPIQTWMKI